MTIIKHLSMATAGAVFIALGTVGRTQAVVLDSTITLGFEGVGNLNTVGNFYDTAPQDFDIVFSPNSLAIVDIDAGGDGNFGNEPSPSTVLFFLQGSASTLNALNGFDTGFSFYYSAVNTPGSIKVYDNFNATGNVLATLNLPVTPSNGGDPNGNYSPFVPIGVSFSGVAKSIDFGGTANLIGFDNVTFGSATPGTIPTPTEVPFEFSPGLGILLLGVWGLAARLKSLVQKRKSSGSAFSKN